MAARRLTDTQREQMAERREAGESLRSLARAFGCSTSNAYWICLSLGTDKPGAKALPPAPRNPIVIERNGHVVRLFTADEDVQLLALEARGMGDSEIAKELGRRPNTIRARLMTLARREARAEGC